ncbi:SLC13 family permease [Thalassotalea piscium]|uniref:Sodium-dependent dicarboxylate transporter 2/3/5 n=2 Tax=Thalassotalea piscium TaxID=1230533 RepID=A0A7X0NF20_9GAMM|nr:DASS family sodium-coupled anion symporter [Thalassotalea piscium]MBB6542272.1 sodium-dependent dicarboxylate transporter 2/3/5 [Thalassotalea piscium]
MMDNELEEEKQLLLSSSNDFRLFAFILGPLVALVLMYLPVPNGMTKEAWALVALILWMAIWWLSEAIPIPATALLPIPLMPILGIGEMTPVASQYGNPIIFLFLGGFLMAVAMQRWGLHKRIALRIVSVVGTNPSSVIGGFMLATAFLSMWISNTSSTIMMYAVALSVIDFVARRTTDEKVLHNFGVALMLGIAYSATIGGVGTLIGTPPNALLASFLTSSYNIQIDFFTWMQFGLPIVLFMLPIAWLLLTKLIFPAKSIRVGNIQQLIKAELDELGPITQPEKVVAGVFICAALGWIFRTPLVNLTGLPINDTSIALVAALLLFAWPASKNSGQFILDWSMTRELPWGILFLFGGGLALSFGFNNTGLALWIGELVSGLDVSTWLLIITVVIAVIYLTEITSNTASTATFLPILGAVAIGLELDPRTLAVPAAVAASMAFMMPIATPPNAIVFSYEKMRLFDMIKAGFLLNIIAVIVTCLMMYLLSGLVFGI